MTEKDKKMYTIEFMPYSRQEQLFKGEIYSEILVHGGILMDLLRVDTEEDVNKFLDYYLCSDVYSIVKRDDLDGSYEKRLSSNIMDAFINEKNELLLAIKSLETNKKKSNIGEKETNKSKQETYEEIMKRRKKYNNMLENENKRIEAFVSYAEARLIDISLGITPSIQETVEIIKETRTYKVEGILYDRLVPTSKNLITVAGITFKFSTDDIFTLAWLELIITVQNNLAIKTCDTCGNYYFNATRKNSKFCPVCGPESRNSNQRTKKDKDRNAIIRQIQRGVLTIEEGNKELKNRKLKEYKPRPKKKNKK
jgi:rRNA maturation endonuclease Nob1